MPIFRLKRNYLLQLLRTNRHVDQNGWQWMGKSYHLGEKIIRACTDFSTGLNDYFEACNYSLPSPENISLKLSGGKVFLKLDLFEVYLQINVDKKCAKYLTINILKGLYWFNRWHSE